MSHNYCVNCRKVSGMLNPVQPGSGQLTAYQQSGFAKHTHPTKIYPENSVFLRSDLGSYFASWAACLNSGHLEIDSSGRMNLVYSDHTHTGTLFLSGAGTVPCDGVKLVLPGLSGFAHLFPVALGPGSATCALCGARIP
jgi:hypothetical protein